MIKKCLQEQNNRFIYIIMYYILDVNIFKNDYKGNYENATLSMFVQLDHNYWTIIK